MADDEQQEAVDETQQTKLGAEQAKALNAVTDNVRCAWLLLLLRACCQHGLTRRRGSL